LIDPAVFSCLTVRTIKLRLKGGEFLGDWLRHAIRLVVSAIVLVLLSPFVPGFAVANFGQALLAAVVITILGYIIESAVGRNISPYGRGIVGFLVSAVVLYATQYIVAGFSVTILGALIAAFLIGLVDIFVPTSLR